MKSRAAMIAEVLGKYSWWKRRKQWAPRGTLLFGEHRITDSGGGTNIFKMEIFVPQEFPAPGVHPKARIVAHDLDVELTDDAHVGRDGTLCVQLEQRNEINYPRDGLAGFFEQVELHLYRARHWSILGTYPGPQYPHYDVGTREYEAERPALQAPFEALRADLPPPIRRLVDPANVLPARSSRCPCGADSSFGHCHEALVKLRRESWWQLGRMPE